MCLQTNMATSEKDSVRSIQSIAETVINQLVSLVEHRGSAATIENAQRPPAATESQTSSSSNEQRSSGTSTNALSELRRRFPTLSRGRGASRSPVTGRFDRSHTSRPYSARRPAGRPLATEIVSKDVIILEFVVSIRMSVSNSCSPILTKRLRTLLRFRRNSANPRSFLSRNTTRLDL
ncbi:hypothetical protein OS493_027683 [Desmophyllum pertusum]|uniref:Uncharacterized protein n=1 Tax=Desmophyllum pertusum TaxID=174260 RepID=A0A9X0D1B5_9CNID|nr:hypothetical protein OS493_015620 [Desmophyllum pertusum]KAJ7383517.1 hypothetical protein OS493_027683 [Desmophyllum pertusum]